ncbi:nitrate/nitrite transporter [Sphaerochaeta pleomorpha str. Grapes]|uniref:Nitrate/nitrite transporter n=1 Tax=Sphaerochaeta pleomorpha (strain ATCC BAA-1885 / DSM 22778 / Grapes) TaxID=158190 RepID=G8QQI8_SPHPG|nr:MFS transporter [Sphaerochaeta pleomorpha]AEV30918.1 nitrate/nitrite transporter [Sphaerochaeta pleomorpha str. Grapes]
MKKTPAKNLQEVNQNRNMNGFLVHALFLALTLNFIDINTVIPNMLAEAGATSFHLGILSAIMIGGAGFMQLVFAGLIIPLKRKKPALLAGIYLRVVALVAMGLFLKTLTEQANWKVWAILSLMALFSFSGAFANISYTDIMGRVIEPVRRKRLLVSKQLISSVGVIVSALLVKLILTALPYPLNYSMLFLLSGILLSLATLGFWMLKETDAPLTEKITLTKRFGMFTKALKEDRNLRLYLWLLNTSGVFLSTIPFLILFARTKFEINGSLVGTFLLARMIGSLVFNILLKLFSKSEQYRPLLYLFIGLGSATLVLALLLTSSPLLYSLVFLLSGATGAVFQIVTAGVLLEISNDENRGIYAGLAGAGSFMNILYPILAGILVTKLGYPVVFLLTSIYILLGLYTAKRIRCERIAR